MIPSTIFSWFLVRVTQLVQWSLRSGSLLPQWAGEVAASAAAAARADPCLDVGSALGSARLTFVDTSSAIRCLGFVTDSPYFM